MTVQMYVQYIKDIIKVVVGTFVVLGTRMTTISVDPLAAASAAGRASYKPVLYTV